VAPESLVARETTVRSYSALASPVAWDPSENLDVVTPAGLVAEGFESDSGTRGGCEGLSDDALGSFVSGHTPRLPLEAGLGVSKEVCFSAVGAVHLSLASESA
jgi:hypothetical protein